MVSKMAVNHKVKFSVHLIVTEYVDEGPPWRRQLIQHDVADECEAFEVVGALYGEDAYTDTRDMHRSEDEERFFWVGCVREFNGDWTAETDGPVIAGTVTVEGHWL
jgi:hypothetical protein